MLGVKLWVMTGDTQWVKLGGYANCYARGHIGIKLRFALGVKLGG